MGCAKSTQKGENDLGSSSRGDQSSHGPPTGTTNTVVADSRLPLTAKQKYSMVASWKGIARALEPTGVTMFLKLFEQNAELLSLFERFKELKTKEQQATSEELQEHATNVMKTVDEAIREMDNLDGFFAYLHETGASHRKIPGFNSALFWKIEDPFLLAVEQTLGDRYTDNIASIYKITIKLIIQTLIDGYEKSGAS